MVLRSAVVIVLWRSNVRPVEGLGADGIQRREVSVERGRDTINREAFRNTLKPYLIRPPLKALRS
jgi:hypothetical protein